MRCIVSEKSDQKSVHRINAYTVSILSLCYVTSSLARNAEVVINLE